MENKIHFAVRLPLTKLEKLKYVAEYNARSDNKEIEYIITKHIEDLEKTHSKIKVKIHDYELEP